MILINSRRNNVIKEKKTIAKARRKHHTSAHERTIKIPWYTTRERARADTLLNYTHTSRRELRRPAAADDDDRKSGGSRRSGVGGTVGRRGGGG